MLADGNQPKEDIIFLGLVEDNDLIGNITIKVQDIIIPATEWGGGVETSLTEPDGDTLQETYVQTFSIEAAHRRKGHGRTLQEAALALTRALGCYQMRSWSSLDKTANYALKLSLGFALHPATYETKDGLHVSGVYFVKRV